MTTTPTQEQLQALWDYCTGQVKTMELSSPSSVYEQHLEDSMAATTVLEGICEIVGYYSGGPTTQKEPEPEVQLVEIAKDEAGNILWEEPYKFSNLSAPGEFMIRDRKHYTVLSAIRSGDKVMTTVREHPRK